MTSNDLKIETSELCLYAHCMKAGNPHKLKIGRKHKFDLIIASNDL